MRRALSHQGRCTMAVTSQLCHPDRSVPLCWQRGTRSGETWCSCRAITNAAPLCDSFTIAAAGGETAGPSTRPWIGTSQSKGLVGMTTMRNAAVLELIEGGAGCANGACHPCCQQAEDQPGCEFSAGHGDDLTVHNRRGVAQGGRLPGIRLCRLLTL